MSMVFLGNLSIDKLENRLGINLSDEDKKVLNDMRETNANEIPSDKFHIFDMPFMIKCGSKKTAEKVFKILEPYVDDFVAPVQIGY